MSLLLAALVAAGISFFLIKSRRNYERLPRLPVCDADATADVTAIIPARNEEAVILRAVGSFEGIRVVVIDDHSEDRTVQAALEAGAEVFKAPPLDPCVLGKPNACRAGAAVADSKWLLFVDADTWYAPHFAASIVSYAESEDLDVVTAFLRQKVVTLAEQVILPYAFALYFTGVSAARVNSVTSREALANGQCMLFRRSSYLQIGGHSAVARSVVEDIALAAHAKAHGLKVRVVRAEHLGAVRMYEGFSALRWGFAKNSFRFLGANLVTGIQVVIASAFLISYLPVLLYLVADDYFIPAAVFSLLPALLLASWYAGPATMWAPIAIYVFEAIAVAAMFRSLTGAKTKWKGRDI